MPPPPDALPSDLVPWRLDETLVRLGDRPTSATGLAPSGGPPPQPGQRYAERGLLGEGGMGRVDEVLDTNLGRRLAMKQLSPALAADPTFRRKFLREAQIQGQLDHPAVVPVHELGADADGTPWFTMRKIHGLTFADVIDACRAGARDAEGRFSLRRRLGWFVQASLAVEYAHSRQVLHLDLKPANLMAGEFGEVYVLDWGLARGEAETQPAPNLEAALLAARERAAIGGTPGFMAPEQVLGSPLDARADVFALGCVLFELLALEPLFPGAGFEGRLTPLPPSHRSPAARAPARGIPPALDALVLAATEPDREHRLPSARALAEAVERFLDGDRHTQSLQAEAQAALADARARIAALDSDSAEEHARAMQSVTRALALAPGHPEAQALLQQVLHAAPASAPDAVSLAQGAQRGRARAQLARSSAVRFGIWLALAPLLWAMGPLERLPAAALTLGVVAAAALSLALGLRERLSGWGVGALVATTSAALFGLSFVFGPFVVVPSLAATAAVLFSGHLRGRDRALAVGALALALVGPWGLELAGLLPPSLAFVGDEIHLLPRLVHFPPVASSAVLTVATVSSLIAPALLNGRIHDALERSEARVRLSAWYLERLGRS